MNYDEESVRLHKEKKGKWAIISKFPVTNKEELSIAYTPGVAGVCKVVAADKSTAATLTMKGNSVAIVSDGSAVLGLGNIGPEAALPVMEGKAILFKEFADIDGIPIVLNTQDEQEIITAVKAIAPTFGGINLEDIAAPKCFAIEAALQDIGIPVFHDDQHGTAVVMLAALMNAAKVTGKSLEKMTIIINGAGAAGTAIAKLLCCVGNDPNVCVPVKNVIVCDSKGIISKERTDLNPIKQHMLSYSNKENISGSLKDALKSADVFIGVSAENLLTADDVRTMAKDPVIFAMANPNPEIMPDAAKEGGALVVGTGRSDFPNQVNNILAYPGIFRGALDIGAPRITEAMKIAAAKALASLVKHPAPENILPDPFDPNIANVVADAVKKQFFLVEKIGRPCEAYEKMSIEGEYCRREIDRFSERSAVDKWRCLG